MEPEYSYAFAKHRLFMARQTKESMEADYHNRRYDKAIDAAYYTVFQLITGIFGIYSSDEPHNNHGQLIGDFNRVFIYEKELFPKDFNKKINFLFKNRNMAVYKNNVRSTKEQCDEIIETQKYLYNILEDFLEEELFKLRKMF